MTHTATPRPTVGRKVWFWGRGRIGVNDVLVDVPHQAGVAPLAVGDPVAVDLDHRRALFLAA